MCMCVACFFLNKLVPGLLESVSLDLLCYVVLLIMPVLGCMSDQDREVRLMAAQCFASLVTYMPLEVCPFVHRECLDLQHTMYPILLAQLFCFESDFVV